ncbi:MAG TPA: hypothetical protein VIL35_03925 [Vicinamibacterales bacterium]
MFVAAFAVGVGLSTIVLGSTDSNGDADLKRNLDRIKAVTRPYHDIAAAHAAGYPREVPPCVASPEGGMGHHFAHPRLMDDRLEIEKPEILVYAPAPDGKLKLAGVEYIVPYSAWSKSEPPRILGQNLKKSDQLQIWYLHVWVWEENEKGVFADWNPAVKCSA